MVPESECVHPATGKGGVGSESAGAAWNKSLMYGEGLLPTSPLPTMATPLWARVASTAALSFLTLLPAQPARADSLPDLQRLVEALASFGTRVVPLECKQKGLEGYYEVAKDQIVICLDALADSDPSSVWDVLAHEATHKMQACVGGFVIPPTYVARMMRQLQANFPETLAALNAYTSSQSRLELEARWMELQTPEFVVRLLVASCRPS
jgi:hypothetical protein